MIHIMTRYNNYTKHKQKVNRNYNKLGKIRVMRENVMYYMFDYVR